MNTPPIYLLEPYNCYAPAGKKKHWMQEVDEQNLLARIIAEQQALRESQTSRTLPDNAPATATPTVGGIPQAGAGAVPPPDYFTTPQKYTDPYYNQLVLI